ncbi:SH3 domain-containing protein [Waltera acetigignens]
MKKYKNRKDAVKMVVAVLCAALMLTACGSKETTSNETASTETTSVTATEATVAEPTAEPAVEPTEAPTESETALKETAPAESPAPAVEPTAAPVESTAVSTGYTYSELSQTMYAKSAVNVRDLPSTDGKKIGSLKASQEITVTGKCDQTGWYRFELNNTTGYVSDKYIVSEKPAVNTVASTNNSNNTAGNTTAATQQNTAAPAATPAPAQTTTTNTTPNSSEPYFDRAMAEQIFALVNADRVANGLNALEWSEDDYNIAMQRCCEDDGHNSMRGGTSENYAFGYTSAQDAYQGWHDSTGHRNNYLNATYTKSAVAARFTPLAGGALGYGTVFYQVFTWDTNTTAYSEPTIVTNTEAAAPKTADENTDTSSSNVGWSLTPPTQEDGLKKWQEQNPDAEVSFGN